MEKKELTKLEKLISNKGLSDAEIRALVDSIKNPQNVIKKVKHRWGARRARIGLGSDVHIGSKYVDYSMLEDVFKRWKKAGVDAVYLAGDITEGYNRRKGHSFECELHGADEQVKGVIERMPSIGVPIYFITGDHDQWHYESAGVSVGKAIAKDRPDMTFLGEFGAKIGLFKNTTMSLNHPAKGTCFDDKTEIMTENGWKLFKNLAPGEKVATLNEKKMLFEWQTPTKYTDEWRDEELYHFVAKNIDLLVTAEHRLLVRKTLGRYSKNNAWIGKKAKDLASAKRQEWQLLRGGQSWKGFLSESIVVPRYKHKRVEPKHIRELCIDDVAELIAWYVTEGHIRKNLKQLNICQSRRVNPENHFAILDLLKRIGLSPHVGGKDYKDIVVGSSELCRWLVSECGSGSKNKYLPKWLKNQPVDVLRIVFDTMIAGDGWINGRGFGYRSISTQLLDDMSEVSAKLGFATTQNKDTLSISSVHITPTINHPPKKVHYRGRVYCVSVPNDTILVRRNGKAIWSKNSYAISYQVQKYIESLSGGQKENIAAFGHYHKFEYLFYRNIHAYQTGCFRGQTSITTSEGEKKICKVVVGDMVLTHKDRYRRVSHVFKRKYGGDFYALFFGRNNHSGTQVVATEEHPILVERNKVKMWVKFSEVCVGDYVFVKYAKCEESGQKIPFYNKFHPVCNPMHLEKVRNKLSNTRGGYSGKRVLDGTGWKHLRNDIIPYCEKLESEGFKAVPVGAGIIPDIVAFKDGKIHLFELESLQGLGLNRKKSKYNDAEIMNFVDELHWINLKERKRNSAQGKFSVDKENGWIKIPVTKIEVRKQKGKSCTVYNVEVEEDNTYFASKVLVHNCFQNQTPWMRRMNLSAHKAAWTLDIFATKQGSVDKIVMDALVYYE